MLGKSKLIVTLAIRNVLRNKRRSFLTIMAVLIGVASSFALSSLARGLSNQMAKNAIYNLTGHVQIHAPGFLDDPVVEKSMADPSPTIERIKAKHSVKFAASRVRIPAVIMSEYEASGLSLVGINPQQEEGLSFIGEGVSEGQMLSSGEEEGVVLGKKMAQVLKTRIGKRVVLIAQDINGKSAERGFRIIGIFDAELESTEKSFAFIGIKPAQRMLGLDDQITELSLGIDDRYKVQGLAEDLGRALPQLDVKAWNEIIPMAQALVDLQSSFLRFWFGIVVIAVSFGLMNTLFMSIYERTREIGLVQALGMSASSVLLHVVAESAILLSAGIAAGNGVGYLIVRSLSSGIDISSFAEGAAKLGISRVIYPLILRMDIVSLNLLVFFICLLASFYPAWKASRYEPVQALSMGH